jgi:hypothetical protein
VFKDSVACSGPAPTFDFGGWVCRSPERKVCTSQLTQPSAFQAFPSVETKERGYEARFRVTVFRDDDDGSLSYLNHAAGSGRSFPSLLTLETKIGCSRSQILLASDSGSPSTSE